MMKAAPASSSSPSTDAADAAGAASRTAHPLTHDDDFALSDDDIARLVNARRDPDVVGHNLLSVIVNPGSSASSSGSMSSSAASASASTTGTAPAPPTSALTTTANPLAGVVESMISWAAFLASLWRPDDPDASFEPSSSPVQTADFLPYLRRVNKAFNAYSRAVRRQSARNGKGIDAAAARAAFRAVGVAGAAAATSTGATAEGGVTAAAGGTAAAEQVLRSDMEELVVLTRPRARDVLEAERHLELTLATVPQMFFEKGFDFRNPNTFLAVTEMPGVVQSVVRPELPRRLGEHLDMVELSLCKQVSVRAGAFYRAQVSLRESHEKVAAIASQIAALRARLAEMRARGVRRPLALVRLQRRVGNLRQVQAVMEDVVAVQSAQGVIRDLLTQSDFHGSLDLVDNTRRIVNTRLSRIRGLATYRRQLDEYEDLIVRTMASRLEVAAVGFRVDQPRSEERLRMQLEPLVSGLLRTGKLEYVLGQQRKRMEAEILNVGRTVVGTYLSSFDGGGGGGGGGGGDVGAADGASGEEDRNWKLGSERLRELKPAQFHSFLELVFEHFLAVVVQATTVHRLLITALDLSVLTEDVGTEQHNGDGEEQGSSSTTNLSTADGISGAVDQALGGVSEPQATLKAASAPPMRAAPAATARRPSATSSTVVISQRDQLALHRASIDVVVSTCVKAERSVAGVLDKRAQRHAEQLSVPEMKALWDVCHRFAEKCEKNAGGRMMCYHLRGKLLEQGQAMLDSIHARNTRTLKRVLDREKWKQADVQRKVQALLNHIQANSHGSFEQILSGGPEAAGGAATGENGVGGGPSDGLAAAPSRMMKFGDQQYRVVGSMQTFVMFIADYLNCAQLFPALSRRVCLKLIELLGLFNKKTRRLVLQAGAVESKALSNIGIRVLALASQCLALTLRMMPSIRVVLASHLPPKFHFCLNDLDKLAEGYRSHQDGLFKRCVDVLENLVEQVFCSGEIPEAGPPIATLTWDNNSGATDDTEASAAMMYFVGKVRYLHKTLQKYLPPEQLKDVFSRIFSESSVVAVPALTFAFRVSVSDILLLILPPQAASIPSFPPCTRQSSRSPTRAEHACARIFACCWTSCGR